tara:strand:- start:61 stop:312 length:252 start_codon:yes stop_codon:yes gene_type:complete
MNDKNKKLTEDLKNSLNQTIKNTSDIFKNLQHTIDSDISDEELRNEIKKIMSHLQNEFKESVDNAQDKIVNTYNKESVSKEEE